MHILDKSLEEIHEALKNGETTSKELLEESFEYGTYNYGRSI